jgi:hypothetical protein
MIKNADAYGAELWDYYTTKKDNREMSNEMIISSMGIERAMAEVSISLNTKIGRLSTRRQLRILVVEFLDVGRGAGKHALYLQKKRLDVQVAMFSTCCKDLQTSWSSQDASSFL